MNLVQIILLEVTQTKKNVCHMFCLMGGTYFKSSDMSNYLGVNAETLTVKMEHCWGGGKRGC